MKIYYFEKLTEFFKIRYKYIIFKELSIGSMQNDNECKESSSDTDNGIKQSLMNKMNTHSRI